MVVKLLKYWVLILLMSTLGAPTFAEKFYPDDPIRVDHDNLTIPEMDSWELSDYYDFVENTFFEVGKTDKPFKAQDINTLGEVPDSSWFINRHGRKGMSLEMLLRGPNHGTGPDMNSPWTVITGKSAGITPGFVIQDGRGDIYFVKFDPKSNPEMATSTEVICTKFFYAMGYHVPENYLVHFHPELLQVGKSAIYTDYWGKMKPLTMEVLEEILNRVHREADGSIRAVASRELFGKPKGPFKYYGSRWDDPNDIFLHQNRRVLRGLYVIASWLNHDDSRSINSLDVYVSEGGSQFLKHYLIDFGSCLGSGSVRKQSLRAGWEYMVEWGGIFKGMATLGLWVRPYLKAEYPDYPSIGRFESTLFQPEKWKPEYPNPAFRNMMPADAFWGAKLVMSFRDDEITAICKTGQLTNEEAESYIRKCLVERRDKIGRYWFSQLLPVDDFVISGQMLRFKNMAREYEFADDQTRYLYEWFTFDNETGESQAISMNGSSTEPAVPIPEGDAIFGENVFYQVIIKGENPRFPKWGKEISVYLRLRAKQMDVVGIDR